MKYYEVHFTVNPCSETACDVLSALLADRGFEAFVPVEGGLQAYIQQAMYDEASLRAATEQFVLPGVAVTYETSEAPDEDWNQTWEEEGFDFVAVDDLVCVHSERLTHTLPQCRYSIVINPRMAFGTGTHPTTQQLLRHLCQADLEGRRVVDAGCGTGVLGILCALRGASHVFSYDIDSWSVENTLVNARLNGVDVLEVHEGDASALPKDGTYDLVIANINRNILLADMEAFACTLARGGQLLLSGFYEADAPLLIERGKEMGLRLLRQTVADGWCMLLLGL